MIPEQAQESDIELLHAISGGDEHALGVLYNRYRLILFSLILRILNSRAEAEDTLQEVFLQVWQRAGGFDMTRGRPFTWLVTLARSRAIDRLRALSSRERTVTDASRETADKVVVRDAVDDAIRSEEAEMVRRALTSLPEEQRRTLMLAYFEGLTQSEIAEKLRQPLGTVKTRMRSGMIRLRELLSKGVKGFG